jgi:hypothetical protein
MLWRWSAPTEKKGWPTWLEAATRTYAVRKFPAMKTVGRNRLTSCARQGGWQCLRRDGPAGSLAQPEIGKENRTRPQKMEQRHIGHDMAKTGQTGIELTRP